MKDYHVEFAKDDRGNELRFRFIFTARKPFASAKSEVTRGMSHQRMLEAVYHVPGIDFMQPTGRYSVEIVVAKTFDPDVVLQAIIDAVLPLQSDLIVPTAQIIRA